jgi:SanA protein
LRWAGIAAIAFSVVIAAMVDVCVNPPKIVAIHATVLAVLVLLAVALPFPAKVAGVIRAILRDLALALVPAFILVVVYANIAPTLASRGRIFSKIEDIPQGKVGLVFGTTDTVAGRENLYFRYRIDTATRVWQAGKIETLIVSGDNRTRYYNEPEKMKQALVERGIPRDRIVCDYAGLRTLDSVVRAHEIFGADSILFISQRFQNERAIYIAKAHGIKAFGFDARDVKSHGGLKTKLREIGARVKMWLDVHFLKTRPRHLGEKETLPE